MSLLSVRQGKGRLVCSSFDSVPPSDACRFLRAARTRFNSVLLSSLLSVQLVKHVPRESADSNISRVFFLFIILENIL